MLSVAASSTKEVSYDATLLAVFKGDEVALQQLISLDLLSVTFKDAVPHTLRAGSPLCVLEYWAALCVMPVDCRLCCLPRSVHAADTRQGSAPRNGDTVHPAMAC